MENRTIENDLVVNALHYYCELTKHYDLEKTIEFEELSEEIRGKYANDTCVFVSKLDNSDFLVFVKSDVEVNKVTVFLDEQEAIKYAIDMIKEIYEEFQI